MAKKEAYFLPKQTRSGQTDFLLMICEARRISRGERIAK